MMPRPTIYYNDNDPMVCAWIRQLMFDGLIPYGVVDSRSILDVQPADLEGFTQCHFFCGIAGWAYALKLAGWPATRPVWTGSPPCQPFSAAGKLEGKEDARHLGPKFISLVRACRPPVLFGEQVASAAVFGKSAKRVGGEPEWSWLDDLSDRLEAAHYAVGASDIPAAGVGAPHIRQRTFFGAVRLADATSAGLERSAGQGIQGRSDRYACSSQSERLADANGRDACAEREQRSGQQRLKPQDGGPERLAESGGVGRQWGQGSAHGGVNDGQDAGRVEGDNGIARDCQVGPERLEHPAGNGRQQRGAEPSGRGLDAGCSPERLADANEPGSQGRQGMPQRPVERAAGSGGMADSQSPGGTDHGGWDDVDWLFCRDGKWRPVKSSFQRLADGLPGSVVPCGDFVPASHPLAQSTKEARRVMRLRGYGNAIVPQGAALFIRAFDTAGNKWQ
jgi:DNA (cytosine-5)-methyltransferase 1